MAEEELIKIFDENKKEMGVATRAEIHKKGYWHETFHCWFVSKHQENIYIYLQKRSEQKKDYPNLLDITAAGHILAHESVEEGVREVEEETGIKVSFDELIPVGSIDYSVVKEDIGFIDKEIANVFLYELKLDFDAFSIPPDEVSGMVRVSLQEFSNLIAGKTTQMRIEGFELDSKVKRKSLNTVVSMEALVPHEKSYYDAILKKIRENFVDGTRNKSERFL